MRERRAPRAQRPRARSGMPRRTDGGALHPGVGGLCDKFMRGVIDRRNFLRTLAWLGVSLASARTLCGDLTFATDALVPQRGGTLRFVCAVQQIVDPALNTWFEASNLWNSARRVPCSPHPLTPTAANCLNRLPDGAFYDEWDL